MIKKISLICSAFVLSGCVSQEEIKAQQDAVDNALKEYVEVVTFDGISQKEIYDESKRWLAKNFKSSKSVIQYDDSASGMIIGKGNFDFPCVGYIECAAYANSNVNFTLTIETKDNRARLKFDDLGIFSPPSSYNGMIIPGGDKLPIWQEQHKPLVIQKLKDTTSNYASEVKSSSKPDDW